MRYGGGGLGQKSLPFIETHGFQVDANLLSEAANPERLCIGSCYHKASLNPVVWCRVKPFKTPVVGQFQFPQGARYD